MRKLHWAERGALAPGRGGGACPLVLPRVLVRACADDTTWTRLPWAREEKDLVLLVLQSRQGRGAGQGPKGC